jgi:hypothetical protein
MIAVMPPSPGQRQQQRDDRHHQHPRQHPRQHQQRHRVDAHDAQRRHLLVHRHGAELGGIGAAGAPGEDDARHQRPELPHQRDADEVRHEDLRPEAPQRDRRLEGEDDAEQHAEQHRQREGARAGLVQVARQLPPAQPPRAQQGEQAGDDHLAQEGDGVERVARRFTVAWPSRRQRGQPLFRLRPRRGERGPHALQHCADALAHAADLAAERFGLQQQRGAGGVHRLHAREVEHRAAARLARQPLPQAGGGPGVDAAREEEDRAPALLPDRQRLRGPVHDR